MHVGDSPAKVSWDFHQKEREGLDRARVYALGAINDLKRLLEGICKDDPNWAAAPIGEFVEHCDGDPHLDEAMRAIGRLIEAVRIPSTTPSTCNECRGRDGIRLPTLKTMVQSKSAHEAARQIYSVFGHYFQRKAFDQLTFQEYGKIRARSPHTWQLDVVDAVLESRWAEIRDELMPVTSFDCDALRSAIERESQAAFELSRDTAMRVSPPPPPDSGKGIPLEHRSRAMSKAEAARFHSDMKPANPTTYFKSRIAKGSVTAPIGSGQLWQFDVRDFPEAVREEMK